MIAFLTFAIRSRLAEIVTCTHASVFIDRNMSPLGRPIWTRWASMSFLFSLQDKQLRPPFASLKKLCFCHFLRKRWMKFDPRLFLTYDGKMQKVKWWMLFECFGHLYGQTKAADALKSVLIYVEISAKSNRDGCRAICGLKHATVGPASCHCYRKRFAITPEYDLAKRNRSCHRIREALKRLPR
jgi:hypothetical protein